MEMISHNFVFFFCAVITRGAWYFEVTIEELPEGAATRIGFGQEYANLQAPLGYDKFGYSWRSRKGTKFHQSSGKKYSAGYGEGDTLGFLIYLPQIDSNIDYMPNTFKDRVCSMSTSVDDQLRLFHFVLTPIFIFVYFRWTAISQIQESFVLRGQR